MDTPTPPPPRPPLHPLPPCPLGQPEVTDLPDVDLHALRANLQLTPDQRLQRFEQLMSFAREIYQAGQTYRTAKGIPNAFLHTQSS